MRCRFRCRPDLATNDSTSPEARLAPAEERRHAFLVVFGPARQRELIDVHMAGEVVQSIGQAIDGQQ